MSEKFQKIYDQHPIYRFEVLKEIKSVEIDPSKLMADIYPSDNKK